MDPEKIGKFICQLRKEKNLSQYQLAELIPISRQGVSKWERGVTTPDPQTLLQLSEMFDVSINELLKGERLQENTIEDLEKTTLSILDQSNKKTKVIKRITAVSITIIILLLLSFLSYYFINSYNSTKVYTIYGEGQDFKTYDGLMIVTNEKMYIKLGRLTNNKNHEISSLKMYYKNDDRKKLIVEDQEIDNLVIRENIGYSEKLQERYLKNYTKKLYLEITYDDNQTEIIKLKFVKDFSNNKLFFTKHPKGEKKADVVKEEKEAPAPQEIKEEMQPTIKEENEKQEIQEETKSDKQKQEEPKQEEPKQGEQVPEPPQEPIITTEQIINKIKEIGIQDMDSYIAECSDMLIFYYETTSKITLFKSDGTTLDYDLVKNKCVSPYGDCEEEFKRIIKENLFS